MAQGAFSSLKTLMANKMAFAAISKASLSEKIGRCFTRTLTSSSRATQNNETLDVTQHSNTLQHNGEHHVSATGNDFSNASMSHNVAQAVRSNQTSYETLPHEHNMGDGRSIEETQTAINYDKLASMLVDELGYVYSRYRENNMEEVLREQIDSCINESTSEVLNRSKELFVNSLMEADEARSDVSGDIAEDILPSKLHMQQLPKKQDFLGIKTVYGDLLRPFSTSSAARAKKDDKDKKSDCDKAKKLPCLQSSELSGVKAEKTTSKGVCERFCMPCCKPARDPPICFYPYKKPECHLKKAPRAAFSECKRIFPFAFQPPCECIRPPVGSCKKQKESAKCTK